MCGFCDRCDGTEIDFSIEMYGIRIVTKSDSSGQKAQHFLRVARKGELDDASKYDEFPIRYCPFCGEAIFNMEIKNIKRYGDVCGDKGLVFTFEAVFYGPNDVEKYAFALFSPHEGESVLHSENAGFQERDREIILRNVRKEIKKRYGLKV